MAVSQDGGGWGNDLKGRRRLEELRHRDTRHTCREPQRLLGGEKAGGEILRRCSQKPLWRRVIWCKCIFHCHLQRCSVKTYLTLHDFANSSVFEIWHWDKLSLTDPIFKKIWIILLTFTLEHNLDVLWFFFKDGNKFLICLLQYLAFNRGTLKSINI